MFEPVRLSQVAADSAADRASEAEVRVGPAQGAPTTRSRRLRVAMVRPERLMAAGFLVAVVSAYVAVWYPVFTGAVHLFSPDILYDVIAPWGSGPGHRQAQNWLLGDQSLQFVPGQQLIREALFAGRPPFWNEYAFQGSPLYADGLSAALSIFTLMALPFPLGQGYSIAMVIKLPVAALGTYLFLRQVGVRGVAALAGAVIYAGSSWMILWMGWPQSSVAALFPYLFALSEWYGRRGGWSRIALLGLLTGVTVLADQHETTFQFGLGLALYCLVRLLQRAWPLHRLAGLGLAAVIGLGIGAVLVLPFAEMQLSSEWTAARHDFGTGHLNWLEAIFWLAPNAAGNPALSLTTGEARHYNEVVTYIGVPGLVLALLAVPRALRRFRNPELGLVLITLLAVLLIYGVINPVVARLPLLSITHGYRHQVVACFGGAVLAAFGLQNSWRVRPIPAWAMGALAAGGLFCGIALAQAAAFWIEPHQVAGLLGYLKLPPLPAAAHYISEISLFWTAFAISLLAAALALNLAIRGGISGAVVPLMLILVVDLLVFGARYNPETPASLFPPRSAVSERLQAIDPDATYAFTDGLYRGQSFIYDHLHSVQGYNIVDRRHQEYWTLADPLYDRDPGMPILKQPDPGFLAGAGVGYLLGPVTRPRPDLVPVATLDGTVIFRVPGARPMVSIPARVRAVADEAEAQAWLRTDPARLVVIEGDPAARPGNGQIFEVRHLSGDFAFDAEMASGGPVMILQSYSRGWSATIDGRPVAIHPANLTFMAVEVPEGSHHVQLSFVPPGLIPGGLLGLGSLLAAFALGLGDLIRWKWRRRRSQSGPAAPRAAAGSPPEPAEFRPTRAGQA